MFFKVEPTKTMHYKLTCRLYGHIDSILTVAMAESRKVLASGGEETVKSKTKLFSPSVGIDSVRLWNVITLEECTYPGQNIIQHGHPSCLIWADVQGQSEQGLFYGTILGYLVAWMHQTVS